MELQDQPLATPEEVKDPTLAAQDAPEEQPAVTTEVIVEQPAQAAPMTKEEIVAAATALAAKDAADINRDEISRLKQQFYSLRHAELDAEKAAFLERGNEEAAFAPMPDAVEEAFKGVLTVIKEKKAAYAAELEARRLANFERKNAIIDELTAMADDADNVNRHFPRFRELQQEFKSVGEVPAPQFTDQWRRYQVATERFYDQWKVNKDLRDYDFRKNLDTKMLLISEAEKLADEPDVIVAFKRLQELHDKWRETGPVAKEQREEIWAKFKDASAVVNKRYLEYFEGRKQRERENEDAKIALCERVETLDFSTLKSFAAWDEMTKRILQAQDEWKKVGPASRKVNNQLFARFRAVCDKFFTSKAEFFKSAKDEMSENLAKKIALCEKVEALKDSTDWKKTTDEIVALQQQWRTVGAVARKHSDAVWQRFRAACDYFFDQKKQAGSGTRKAEQANLKEKKAIIAELKAIDPETPAEEATKKVKELTARYQQVGHVPFRDKDKLRDEYRAIVDELYARFRISASRASMVNFETALADMAGDEGKMLRERDRLMRDLDRKRAEIQTFENNLGFFNSKSKDGNSMLREMERRIGRLRDDLSSIEKKIAAIDEKLS